MSKLRKCVDCGNGLSETAKECGNCKSTDPFGGKRATEKAQMTLFIIVILALIVTAILQYTGIINIPIISQIFKM